ncbi:hypothetical protein ABZX40_17930 [Streptomyces sp. NPDC004610]|uniref:hypothetical protein n=1 Tax=unclassified Streptomyces TaxID=2593676 RepID=UPI0033A5C4A2
MELDPLNQLQMNFRLNEDGIYQAVPLNLDDLPEDERRRLAEEAAEIEAHCLAELEKRGLL